MLFRRLALGTLLVYWLALVIGTHLPKAELPQVFDVQDKLIHLLAYSGLTALVCLAGRSLGISWTFATGATLLCVLAAHAAVDEITQDLVGRSPELGDWIADVLGVVCGLLVGDGLLRTLPRWRWLRMSAAWK